MYISGRQQEGIIIEFLEWKLASNHEIINKKGLWKDVVDLW